MRRAWLIGCVLPVCLLTGPARAEAPATQPAAPTSQPASPATQPAADDAARVDQLLTRLEAEGEKVRDLKAGVGYTVEETLVGTRTTRIGELFVSRPAAEAGTPRRGKFLVRFDRVIADGESARETESYLFDGEFLVTRKDERKLASRQRLVEPGETLDPFKLDGPFPVPFGARKADMQATFEIGLAPPPTLKALPANLPPGDTLWLTPRPDSKLSRDIRHLLLVLDPATGLPSTVVSYEQQDKIKRAGFRNVQINAGLPEETFRLEIPKDYKFDDSTK